MRVLLAFGSAAMTLASLAVSGDAVDAQKLAEFNQIVKAKHPGFIVSFYCVGSFTRHDAKEYAIGATKTIRITLITFGISLFFTAPFYI